MVSLELTEDASPLDHTSTLKQVSDLSEEDFNANVSSVAEIASSTEAIETSTDLTSTKKEHLVSSTESSELRRALALRKNLKRPKAEFLMSKSLELRPKSNEETSSLLDVESRNEGRSLAKNVLWFKTKSLSKEDTPRPRPSESGSRERNPAKKVLWFKTKSPRARLMSSEEFFASTSTEAVSTTDSTNNKESNMTERQDEEIRLDKSLDAVPEDPSDKIKKHLENIEKAARALLEKRTQKNSMNSVDDATATTDRPSDAQSDNETSPKPTTVAEQEKGAKNAEESFATQSEPGEDVTSTESFDSAEIIIASVTPISRFFETTEKVHKVFPSSTVSYFETNTKVDQDEKEASVSEGTTTTTTERVAFVEKEPSALSGLDIDGESLIDSHHRTPFIIA